jgi:prephenate dehydratase
VFDTVAIQGERGSFSDAAARKLLGADVTIHSCRSFDDLFAAVTTGRVAAAVVPIENSLAGSVLRSYELLGGAGLTIVREALLRISMNLIGVPAASLSQVRRVLSHPVALAQCQRFLAEHPEFEAIATHDTAGSVQMVMEANDPTIAAIAGVDAAEAYGAEVLVRDIQDHAENFTRFLLVTHPSSVPDRNAAAGSAMKTTVLFNTPNKPGALFRALAAFALRDINLTKLESRPIAGRPWEYVFYADISGAAEERDVANALNHLREMCDTVTVLGTYPAASSEQVF